MIKKMFDTLSIAQRLKAAGFSEAQAEALAYELFRLWLMQRFPGENPEKYISSEFQVFQ
jgi:hypothetical protein